MPHVLYVIHRKNLIFLNTVVIFYIFIIYQLSFLITVTEKARVALRLQHWTSSWYFLYIKNKRKPGLSFGTAETRLQFGFGSCRDISHKVNMGRAPCCDKMGLKKGPWTPEEDLILINHINTFGHKNWRALPKQAGNYILTP